MGKELAAWARALLKAEAEHRRVVRAKRIVDEAHGEALREERMRELLRALRAGAGPRRDAAGPRR